MKNLINQIEKLNKHLIKCIRCGMCQAVCPLFLQTGHEADVARGKIALIDGLVQNIFTDPKGTLKRINKCLLCGSCADICPRNIDIIEIFIKARIILTTYMGLSFPKKMILRGLLSNPNNFNRLLKWGSKCQNLLTKPVNQQTNGSCARFIGPISDKRHFKLLAKKPFHQLLTSSEASSDINNDSEIRVAFFIGCVIDKVFPHVAQTVVDILKHHGIGLFIPKHQGCCGIPAISSGDIVTFNRLLDHNIKKFDPLKFDYIISACATCTFTIKKIWPMITESFLPEHRAKTDEIAKKTVDINQFIVSVFGIKDKPCDSSSNDDKTIITYHDPCHLSKSLGVAEQPRRLIKANPRFKFREMNESSFCCGMGGNFNLQYYEISNNIAKRKLENIIASECKIVTTGCPGCMMQLSDIISKSKENITVKHSVEIYGDMIKNQVNFQKL